MRFDICRHVHPFILVILSPLILGQDCAGTQREADMQRTMLEQEEQIAALEQRIADQEKTIADLQAQVMELRGQDADALDRLVHPVRIELEKLSGGYDDDGEGGDDGVILYIRPIDADGHVIKAAGSLKVVLYDLANPPERNTLGDYYFDQPTMRELWYGRMWTHHFTVRCPWPPDHYPDHDEITADVVFTDLLTGRRLRAQQMFKVNLHPPGEEG
jgi:uncharacterized coiled-coil protein SlyX